MHIFKLIKEYIRRIVRNYKIYSITILGMSIAIIASFYIYFHVLKEYSYNTSFNNNKQIYRVESKGSVNYPSKTYFTEYQLAPTLEEGLPEVKNSFRIIRSFFKINKISEEIKVVDSTFFSLLGIELIKGSLAEFGSDPNALIITETAAEKQFGKGIDPINKTIETENLNKPRKLVVVGVIKDLSAFSTIQADYFISTKYLEVTAPKYYKNVSWGRSNSETYIEIENLQNQSAFENKMTDFIFEKVSTSSSNPGYQKGDRLYRITRLDKIYFDSADVDGQKIKGTKEFVLVLILVGFLCLFLAVTNYVIMNLGINLNRAGEFVTKRYLGATKKTIFLQLFIESFINISLCVLLIIISHPYLSGFMSSLLGFDYVFDLAVNYDILIVFAVFLFVVSLIIAVLEYAITYKSIFLKSSNKKAIKSKRIIIILQITILLSILISSFIVQKQVNHIVLKDKGFNTEDVVSVMKSRLDEAELQEFIKGLPYVKAYSNGDNIFKIDKDLNNFKATIIETNTTIDRIHYIKADENYFDVYDVEIKEGRGLNPQLLPSLELRGNMVKDRERRSKLTSFEVLVNEEFVKKTNLKNPIGTLIQCSLGKAKIVGVFKNIYTKSLYHPLQPIIYGYDFRNSYPRFYQVKVGKENISRFKKDLKPLFLKYSLGQFYDRFITTFDYEFIYKKEYQLKRLLQAFSIIVLFIAVLGLIAISLFVTQNRIKEIGIRKINGATTLEILKMLNKSFVIWVGIAFVFAAPISYIVMEKWLRNFAFKTTLSWWIFALAGLLVLIIALLAVSWQTYKAATQNPVNSLRDD